MRAHMTQSSPARPTSSVMFTAASVRAFCGDRRASVSVWPASSDEARGWVSTSSSGYFSSVEARVGSDST